MKKLFTLLICVLFIQQIAYNQITVTDLDPQVGDYFSIEGYESSLDPGLSGANVTWDFSGLGAGDNGIDYEVVLTDGLAGEENFPLSTKAWTATLDDVDDFIFYMGAENNALVEYGSYFVAEETVVEINYSDPQIRYNSPLDYGDTGSDNIAGSLIIGTMILSTFTGDIVYDVDGYGTLIMPNGTYDNALRVHTIQEEIHELGVGGGIIQTTTVTGYSYFVEDFPIPVLIIEDSESYVLGELTDEFSSMTRLISYNSVLLGVDNISVDNNLMIYPNPSSEFITLTFNNTGLANLRIINIDGKVAKSLSLASKTKVDISDLTPGYYIAELLVDGNIFSRSKFIITR